MPSCYNKPIDVGQHKHQGALLEEARIPIFISTDCQARSHGRRSWRPQMQS
jgi:hypothetical protein